MAKRKEPTLLDPAIRIDGGKRTNLKLYRERRAQERKRAKPPVEDTRVSEAWVRHDAMSAVAKEKTAERKRMRGLSAGGAEGSVIVAQDIKISGSRSSKRPMRCRPGTFEWRYGRGEKLMAYFHAGSHFADLYERAGTAAASSPDLAAQGSGDWKGLPDSRVAALDALRPVNAKLGEDQRLRLVAYCVEGLPVSDIAIWAGVPSRDMAAIIHSDMTALAKALHFL